MYKSNKQTDKKRQLREVLACNTRDVTALRQTFENIFCEQVFLPTAELEPNAQEEVL